jgi:cbb3-type cytochrome oxidase subunit 3
MKKSILLNLFSVFLLTYSVFLLFTTNRAIAQSAATIPAQYAQNSNYQKTSWKVINDSLTDLLDDGWRIISSSSYRMAIATTGGVGAFDTTAFVYTLNKSNKHVTCFIYDPTVKDGASSGCRQLN